VNAVEAELTMRLAAPAEPREAARPTLVELLRRVDSRAYTALLAERGLLTLLGSRAIELAPEAVDDVVRSVVESARREARLRALMLDTPLRRVVSVPEDAGVPTLPIKGTTLADRVHGDPGLRPTTDVDVLLSRAQIRSAVGALRALGYAAPEDPVWADGLPEMHYTFGAGDAAAPRVELHWRVYASERSLSDELLHVATEAPDGLRRADPAHELALLLVIYGCDGLYGPRLVTDIAAWWDRCGDQVASGALDTIVAQPGPAQIDRRGARVPAALRRRPRRPRADRRPGRPKRAARRRPRRSVHSRRRRRRVRDRDADRRTLVDGPAEGGLPTPVLQPLPFVRSAYGLRDAPTAVVAGRGALHALGTVVKRSPRMIHAARRSPERPTLLGDFPTEPGSDASGPTHVSAPRGPPP
jgi:hypothetical protein